MKLLCDVCELNVASLVCCADEAALCSSCDSRVHAANKLASKHQRVPLLSDTMEPALCDICQERSSFFFCVEDRALLCRECDISIHSANALVAKHRRFVLTGIKVGMNSTGGPSQEVTSSEPPHLLQQASPPVMSSVKQAANKPQKQSSESTTLMDDIVGKSSVSSPQKPSKSVVTSPIPASKPSSYVITKDGTLSTSSSFLNSARGKAAAASGNTGNATRISIQRVSGGPVPFVAPVLSSFIAKAARTQDDYNSNKIHNVSNSSNNSNSNSNHNNNNNSNKKTISISMKNSSSNGIRNDYSSNNNSSSNIMDLDASSSKASVSDYLTAGVPGWKLDELLTDLVGVCENGKSTQPPKESITLGFGHDDEGHPWFAELDFLEEPNQLSSSQEEGVALVPEMPSPPTASGLVTTRAKSNLPWTFDYLFNGPHEPNDVSVVPDIGGGRSSPSSPVSVASKKRKYWMDT